MMYPVALCVALLPAVIYGSALRFFGPNNGYKNVNVNAVPVARADHAFPVAATHDYDHGSHGMANNHAHLLTAANNAHNKPYGGPQYAYNFLKNDGHSFGYGIDDPVKGAHAEHVQREEGGVVRGSYVVREADGTPRLVNYVADQTGFRAVVSDRNGVTKHGFGEQNAPAGLIAGSAPLTQHYDMGSATPQLSHRSGLALGNDNGQYVHNNHDNGQYVHNNNQDNGQYVHDNTQENGQYVPQQHEMATAPIRGVVGYGYQFAP